MATIYTEKEIEYLKNNYHWNDKDKILNELYPHSWNSILTKSKQLGLSRPKIKLPKLRKLLDNNVINAYWWGFIMSDGHINKRGELVICLNKLDKEHLENLKKYLNYDSKLMIPNKDPNMVRLSIMDKIYGIKLKNKLQIGVKKTYNPPKDFSFLKNKDEMLSFLIGFIDGDGHISYSKYKNKKHYKGIRIVVHENWFDFFDNFLTKIREKCYHFNTVSINYNKRKNTEIYIGSISTLENLRNFIEDNNITILKRKWYYGIE